MHLEFLVEDQSGKRALEVLIPKIIGAGQSFRIHAYKGIGRIPTGMRGESDPSKRILLNNLPRLLSGYGQTCFEAGFPDAVFVICDLDDRNSADFLAELEAVLDGCLHKPKALFCLAIEEGEAWLLGDLPAIRASFPQAKVAVLQAYENDSICGTWEVLANALVKGGAKTLVRGGWQDVGAEKSKWALRIPPEMDVEQNQSPSFQRFRDALRKAVESA
jgi:hypothetical protein